MTYAAKKLNLPRKRDAFRWDALVYLPLAILSMAALSLGFLAWVIATLFLVALLSGKLLFQALSATLRDTPYLAAMKRKPRQLVLPLPNVKSGRSHARRRLYRGATRLLSTIMLAMLIIISLAFVTTTHHCSAHLPPAREALELATRPFVWDTTPWELIMPEWPFLNLIPLPDVGILDAPNSAPLQ
jgi:hypothetical protein